MTTREEAIELAREAGLMLIVDSKFGSDAYISVNSTWPAIERLIDAAKRQENEASIEAVRSERLQDTLTPDDLAYNLALSHAESAIRARMK